uniref:Uncharacterized protein n=1 Tax=Corethron hystrix TaxID=216773 RepID=A0A6U5G1Z6_9STRA|mmetsp:Transcript_25210/g.58242  ORF Transcript_25210/g.58242 Transcript_25210/m.58242 type:complete len:113 (+) Transcript_25210:99-437(+)
MRSSAILLFILLPSLVSAFLPVSRPFLFRDNQPLHMGIERLEFKIYADGRVEERVTGVKGGKCEIITDEINKALGKVVSNKPTEEMYESEITIQESVELTNGPNNKNGYSSW